MAVPPLADSGPGEPAGTVRRSACTVWAERFRLVIFAVNGITVFAAGLLIQVLLIRYAGMSHVTSYVTQTVISVQLSFLLSRYLTWRDRQVAVMRAWSSSIFSSSRSPGSGWPRTRAWTGSG